MASTNSSDLLPIKMDPWFLFIHHLNYNLATPLSILLNSIVLYGLLKSDRKEMKIYKCFLVLHTLIDICYTICAGLMQLGMEVRYGTLVLVIPGPIAYFGSFAAKSAFFMFNVFFILNLLVLPVTFLYRYILICKSDYIFYYCNRFTLVGVSIIITAWLLPILGFVGDNYVSANKYIVVFRQSGKDVFDTVEFVHLRSVSSVWFIFTISLFGLVVLISYSIIFISSHTIYRQLRSVSASLSARTKSAQRTLNHALLMQALTPFASTSLPTVVLIYLIICKQELNYVPWFLAISYIWQPLLNACISLAFIPTIWQAFAMSWMQFAWSHTSHTSSSSNSSQQRLTGKERKKSSVNA
ncbi:hypothetical protein QR680_008119 [Steinernema hermaphroditum]|uniref:Uncharacterized protein n=1 Tax=Steinernema hermaphroditum TaxID=289476 RepID=A0AA39IHM9_9BILA|nr:hypothetical protein QR680_008119 [Steinernema hermaphroditum]